MVHIGIAPSGTQSSQMATAEDYVEQAEHSAATGSLLHARLMIATALTFDPLHRQRVDLADRLLDAHPAGLSEHPEEDRAFFGLVALYARKGLREGRSWSSIAELVAVITLRPDIPYLQWVPSHGLEAITQKSLRVVGPRLAKFFRLCVPIRDHKVAAENIAALSHLLLQLWNEFPGHPQLGTYRRITLRERGLTNEAQEFALAWASQYPSWQSFCAVANGCREQGDLDGAIKHLERAALLAPTEPSIPLDLGDLFLQREEWSRAELAYQVALELDPGNSWAVASLAAVQARQGTAGMSATAGAESDDCGD